MNSSNDYISRKAAAKLLGYTFGGDVVRKLHEVPAANVSEAQPAVVKEDELLQQLREEAEVVELQVYLNQYRQALYQLNQFIQQNTLGTLMLSEAVGLDKDAPYGGLDLYLIPKDPSLYAKPSLVDLVRSTNLFNIWQRSEHARSADQPLPQFDWSKLEYPRFGPFKFYIGSHLGWSKDEHD